nr:immunoglobulin heavy chain junction region [Macaca mulatta]MOY27744.1 immunoglobulin heavy chain junction region [Macaca mulatta]MOY29549.1 immunoglobulin heavy chain junction region [Macaca mulatta]
CARDLRLGTVATTLSWYFDVW